MSATPLTVRMEYNEERQTAPLTNLYLRATPRFDKTLSCCDERRYEYEYFVLDYRFLLLFPMGLNPTVNLMKEFLSLQTQQGNFRAAKAQPCTTSRYFTILGKKKYLLSSSQNEEHSRLSNLYSIKWIDVKYSIFVTLERFVTPNFLTLTKEY